MMYLLVKVAKLSVVKDGTRGQWCSHGMEEPLQLLVVIRHGVRETVLTKATPLSATSFVTFSPAIKCL